MKHPLHRTVQRHTYGLLHRVLPFRCFKKKRSRKSTFEIIFKAIATLFFVWFLYFYYFFSATFHFNIELNTDPKVCGKAKYVRAFMNVQFKKLEEQMKITHDLLHDAAIDDVPVANQILPITQKILETKTPICPKKPTKLFGSIKLNNNTASLSQDLLSLKKKIEELRLASVKLYSSHPDVSSDGDRSFEHSPKDLELPSFTPRLKEIPFVYPLNKSTVPVTLSLERPPFGVISPTDCFPHRRTAIIIPYRNREEHLKLFIRHVHDILIRQQIEYGIYVINMAGDEQFNRAKLLNVGYKEALHHYGHYDCFIFHDVDLLPEDDRNLYTCNAHPKHMSVAINIFQYQLPYRQIFGGVSAMTPYQFELVNGYSNEYWGWGGEDDDMFFRLTEKCMHIFRISTDIARYHMERHHSDKGNEAHAERFNLLSGARNRMAFDGLSSLKYTVLKRDYQLLYNNISVNIGHPAYFSLSKDETFRGGTLREVIFDPSILNPASGVSPDCWVPAEFLHFLILERGPGGIKPNDIQNKPYVSLIKKVIQATFYGI